MEEIRNFEQEIESSYAVWESVGVDTNIEFELIIKFYKADRSSNEDILDSLAKKNYNTTVNLKRTLLFFKGTEVLATKKQLWNKETLLEELTILEGLGNSKNFNLEQFLATPNIE